MQVVYHFFLDDLDDFVKSTYRIVYNSKTQHYYLYHKILKHKNCFIIVRTSKRCYRVCHYREIGEVFSYFSCATYKQLAHKINGLVWRYVFEECVSKPP